jgi:hypothetical protein
VDSNLPIDSQRSVARTFVECIARGQDGLWAVTPRSQLTREPRWFDSEDALVEFVVGEGWGVMDYFVPHAFQRKERKYEYVTDFVNVVRADIDPPKHLTYEEQQEVVTIRLGEISAHLGKPTAIVDSGRGRWVYFKLATPILKEEARLLNRALHMLARSEDERAYNPNWWARLPGSINEKTGMRAFVADLDESRVFDPEELDLLLREFTPKTGKRGGSKKRASSREFFWTAEQLERVVLPPDPVFSADVLDYIDSRPTTEESVARWGRTRHQMEERIFINLAGNGWTNLQIHGFAYQRGLSRYMEEFEKRSPYADHSIARARDYVEANPISRKSGEASHHHHLRNRKRIVTPSRCGHGSEGATTGREAEASISSSTRSVEGDRWLASG